MKYLSCRFLLILIELKRRYWRFRNGRFNKIIGHNFAIFIHMNLLFIFSETNQSDTWSIKWVIYIIRGCPECDLEDSQFVCLF